MNTRTWPADQRWMTAIVIAIAVLAIGVRLFQLGTPNFWYDEAASLSYARDLSRFDVHPPTYYVTLAAVLPFSTSEFALRLSSMIAGLAAVAVVYYIGRDLFPGTIQLIATLLAALSPMLVWHAQEARMYSQALAFSLLTVYFYLRIRREQHSGNWIGYIISALLAIYTHLYSAFIPFILTLHMLLFHRHLLRGWIVAHIIIALGYLPWVVVLINYPPKQIGTGRPFSIFNIFYTYYAFTTGYSLGPSVNELRGLDLAVIRPYLLLIAPISILVGILTVFGAVQEWRKDRNRAVLLLLWAFAPVVIAAIIPLFRASMTFNARYVIAALPALVFLIAVGIAALPRLPRIAALGVLVFYSGLSLYNHYFDQRYAKEDVRAAAEFIQTAAEPEDTILVITVGQVFDWYFDGDNRQVSTLSSQPLEVLIDEATQDSDIVWVVESRPWQTDPRGRVLQDFEANYQLLAEQSFTGVKVYQYCIQDCPVS
jgi:uncharacterized membrane protein